MAAPSRKPGPVRPDPLASSGRTHPESVSKTPINKFDKPVLLKDVSTVEVLVHLSRTGPNLETVARQILNDILVDSIERVKEFGGMIYKRKDGTFATKPPMSQGDPTRVDVGQDEPNCGCPIETTPAAYYHTHPFAKAGDIHGDYNHFSGNDTDIADKYHIDAYLGTLDGSFIIYDHKTKKPVVLKGRLRNTR